MPAIYPSELCAALTGAQLANLLNSELTIPRQSVGRVRTLLELSQ